MKITKADAEKAFAQVKRMKSQMARIEGTTREAVGEVVRDAVAGGTSFALGATAARVGAIEVVGVPVELIVWGAGHGAGFAFDLEGSHAIATGALCTYMTALGASVGAKARAKKGLPPATKYELFGGSKTTAASSGSVAEDYAAGGR